MKFNKTELKKLCFLHGANLVGVASADSFIEAPKGSHPQDVLPSCKSVLVLGCEFPHEALEMKPAGYTKIRNQMTSKMNKLAMEISKEIKAEGVESAAVKSINSSWRDDRNRGPISLKHAAQLAGLGKIGKNTLLVNKHYGNMIWLSAVLTSIPLKSDAPADYEVCKQGCKLCIKNCPVSALGNDMMEQKICRSYAFKTKNGKLEIGCWKCRQICPNHLGLVKKIKSNN
jgi:epoxyqueuosine reductase